MDMKILTVISYGPDDGESYRVTLNPINVVMVVAAEALVNIKGMNLHKTIVSFAEEGTSATLYVNRGDLQILEEAVGFYGMEDE